MPDTIMRGYGVEHPAPHGGAVSLGLLWAGLLGAPAAWAIQLVLSYGLASQVCFPREYPRPFLPSGSGWLWPTLVAVNIVALLAAALAIFISFRNWRRTGEEASGGHRELLEAGEGRTRFLAVWGIWSGVWFLVAIIFSAIALIEVPLCGS